MWLAFSPVTSDFPSYRLAYMLKAVKRSEDEMRPLAAPTARRSSRRRPLTHMSARFLLANRGYV